MNWVDLIFFGIGAYLALRGWQNGIIKTVFRYLSILAGFAAAITLNDYAKAALDKSGLEVPEFWLGVIGYIAVFIIAAASIQAVGHLMARLIKPTPLGPVDRAGGALFGAFKIFILSLLVSFLLSLLPGRLTDKPVIRNSFVVHTCLSLLPLLKEQWEHHQETIDTLDIDDLKYRFQGKDSSEKI